MFPYASPAGFLPIAGGISFPRARARILVYAGNNDPADRTLFTSTAGQNAVFGVLPGPGAIVAAIQVYSVNNLNNPSGFRYGDIRTDGTAVTITSAALGPTGTGIGAPAAWPLRFRVNGILHTIGVSGDWSFINGAATIDVSGNFQAPRFGAGVAPVTAMHIGVGGSLQFDRPDAAHQFRNSFVANDTLLTWNYDAGATIMSLDSGGNLTLTSALNAASAAIGVGGLTSLGAVSGATLVAGSTTIAGSGNNAVMQRIGQVVCAGSQSSVSFSSIPATFTNLLLVFSCRDTLAGTATSLVYMKMNGDATAGNYDTEQAAQGSGATASAGTSAPTTSGALVLVQPNAGATAGLSSVGQVLIPNYAGTTFFKQFFTTSYALNNTTPVRTIALFGASWKSTAAINALVITTAGTAFLNGSTFTLYGMP